MVKNARSRRSGPRDGHRAGNTLLFILAAVAALSVTIGVVFAVMRRSDTASLDAPLTDVVKRGPYKHEVIEQGEVESSNNIEIRCEVRARNVSGPSTSIMDIVKEGTPVQKGDWLVSFDSSTLELERSAQKILVNTSEALMIQAKATYETAIIAKKEYLEGSYKEQEKTILNQIFVAEETLKKAQLSYDSIKRLVLRGLLNSLQLEGEQFRVDAARNDLDLSKRRLMVLEEYTRERMLTQLESDIKSAEVKYKNEQDSHQEEKNKLRDIEDQISKCRVLAPQDGQVVYANIQSSRSASEFVVEPGAMVRERQTVIRLPDATSMQVKAKIAESRINLVREGMPVSIRIDAFGESFLLGQVTRVNKYAEPTNFWNSTAKEYGTIIQIVDPPPMLRVGLTAEVKIQIEDRPDAVLLPVQAVYERHGKTFCLVKEGERWDTREIHVSSTNEKVVAIDPEKSDPVREGEEIVLHPRRHVALFDASKLPQAPPEQTFDKGAKAKLAALREETIKKNKSPQENEKIAAAIGDKGKKKAKRPPSSEVPASAIDFHGGSQ